MAVDVRACTDLDEFEAAFGAIGQYFGMEPNRERAERFTQSLPIERMHAARDDGEIVGGAGAFPFTMTVPGARVPCGGVTVVGVYPTHRRRGVLSAMMRAQLDDIRERGEPIAALWASDERIYGRFGYGLASWGGQIRLVREHGAYAMPYEPAGTLRIVDAAEAEPALRDVHDRWAAATPGAFARDDAWWSNRILLDPPDRRSGRGPKRFALYERDGDAAGYAVYRHAMSWDEGSSTGVIAVVEAFGVDPEATAAVWRYLLDVDWYATLEAFLLPVDHALFFLLAEPRRMRFRVGDALWVRLVDVGAALSRRTYAADDAVVLEVRDDFVPDNAGRWKLEDGGAKRTDEDPDIELDVRDLGSVYLGGNTFAQLQRGLRVRELTAGALARADAMFRTDRAPWCPEIF